MNNCIIVSNQVECRKCGDRPYSAHRHDFKWCKCGSIAVDGGQAYLKRVGASTYKELSICLEQEDEQALVDMAQGMIDTGRNARGIVYGVLREMRDRDLLKIERVGYDL